MVSIYVGIMDKILDIWGWSVHYLGYPTNKLYRWMMNSNVPNNNFTQFIFDRLVDITIWIYSLDPRQNK